MTTYIKDGFGFDTGPCMRDFARANGDTPIELAPAENARPGHVIGYIAGNPASRLGFMRGTRVRVHVQRRAIVSAE